MLPLTSRSLAGAVLIASATAAFALGARPPINDEAANARIAPVARVVLGAAGPAAAAGSRSGEDLYRAACAACHDTGAANAPKTGDKAAWAPRLGLGLDGLIKSAIKGKNAMPPKGGVADATDAELSRAIVLMANKSGASFK